MTALHCFFQDAAGCFPAHTDTLMKYAIQHEIPGRMRVHCTGIYLNPESSLQLDRWVDRHETVVSARLSTRTGSLVIRYSRQLSRTSLLVMLDELQLFGVAKVAREVPGCRVLAETVCKSCAREALSSVVRAVVPSPVRHVMTGWRTATRVSDLVRMAQEGDVWSIALAVSRCFLFALYGATPALRFLFILARSLLRYSRLPAAFEMSELPGEQDGDAVPVDAIVVGSGSDTRLALPLLPA